MGSILRPGKFRRDPRQLDEEEEMWFNDDDYEPDDPNGNSGAGPGSSPSSHSSGSGGGLEAMTAVCTWARDCHGLKAVVV